MAEANYSIKAQIEANTRKFKSAIQSAKKVAQNFKKTQESIKDTKLDGDSSGVMKAVKAAKDAVKSFDNTHADAELDADISDVREKVAQAKTLVEKFDAYRGDAELDADVSKATANIKKVQKYLDMYDNSDAEADADVNIKKAITHISELQNNLDRIDGNKYSAELDADATRAREHIKMAKKQLNDFAHQKAKANADVETKGAIAHIEAFKAMLRSIPNRIHTRIDVDGDKSLGFFASLGKAIDESTRTWDKLATKIRTIGTVLGNMIKGVLISNISLLVPAIASLVPALMAVLNAIGVVSGGALGLAGAFGVAGAGAVAFGAMGISALTMLADGTLEATRETERYEASLDSLKSAWAGLIQQNQAQIFNTLANSIDTAKVALAGLTPFINGVSKGMEQASAKMLDWAKNSQVAQKFFEMMGTTGVRIFNNMLDAAGSFGSGLISVLTQIAPLAEWVSQGFKKMGQSFNEWAQSVEGQNAIKSFIEYTKQNLPLIGQIFGSTFRGIFNLMKAFAPNTHLVLQGLADMAKQFEQWSATIAESDGFKKFIEYVQENGPKLIQLLGNIINIIINVATAMAPFAAAVLDVAIAMTDFIEKLTEAHPAIGIMLGLIATLAGIFMTLGPPILGAIDFIGTFVKAITGAGTVIEGFSVIGGIVADAMELVGAALVGIEGPALAVVAVVAAVIAIFVGLWNSSEVVRDAVTGAWDAISSAVGNAVKAVINFFKDLLGQMDYVKGAVESLGAMWDGFVTIVEGAIKLLSPLFESAFNAIVNTVKIAWEVIKAVITVGMHVIVGTITVLLQILTGDWQGAWQTLQEVGQAIWNAIVQAAVNIFNILKDVLSQSWQATVDMFSTIFGPLAEIASTIWNAIVQAILTVVVQLGVFLMTTWTNIVTVAQTMWTMLIAIAQTVWTAIVTAITTIVTTLGTILSTIWTGIVTVATTIWTTLVTVAQTIWTMLVTVITTVVQAILNVVTTVWTTLLSVTSSIMSAISSVISSIWSSIVSIISSIVSSIVSFVSSGWSNLLGITSSIMSSIMSIISSIWNSIVSAISSAVSRAVSFVSSGFRNMVSAVMSAMSSMISAVVSGMARVVSSVTSGVSNAVSAARSFIGHMRQVGVDLIQGMINGVVSMARNLVNAARNVVMGAVNAAKSALHIGSPSKLFKQFGVWTMEGLGIGINKEGKNVIGGMGSMANSITDAFNSNLAIPDITANMKKVSANMNAQVQHTHNIKTNPSQRVVRIEMDVNNEALATIVNGQTANDDTVFSF